MKSIILIGLLAATLMILSYGANKNNLVIKFKGDNELNAEFVQDESGTWAAKAAEKPKEEKKEDKKDSKTGAKDNKGKTRFSKSEVGTPNVTLALAGKNQLKATFQAQVSTWKILPQAQNVTEQKTRRRRFSRSDSDSEFETEEGEETSFTLEIQGVNNVKVQVKEVDGVWTVQKENEKTTRRRFVRKTTFSEITLEATNAKGKFVILVKEDDKGSWTISKSELEKSKTRRRRLAKAATSAVVLGLGDLQVNLEYDGKWVNKGVKPVVDSVATKLITQVLDGAQAKKTRFGRLSSKSVVLAVNGTDPLDKVEVKFEQGTDGKFAVKAF